MKRLRRASMCLALIGLVAAGASADIVHLKDGTRIEGDVKHADDGWNIHTSDGKTVHIYASQLESIELTGTAASAPAVAADRLISLRRSVRNMTDLKQVIARFQRFADSCTVPEVKAEAEKDLATWQDRVNQKMVKIGDQWVLPGERQKLMDQAALDADQARQLLKQGRSKEADPLLKKALSIDPQNAAALYLTGVIQYQQEKVPAARKSFEAVAALVPNDAPTLNDLAVVLWRQKQFIAAVQNYDSAMLSSPVNKAVLDNVACALLALPDELKKSRVATKALRHFQDQDQQLSERLSQAGLHRYGAVWMSDRDVQQLHQQEKQTQDRLDLLSGEFDRTKARIGQLDQNMGDNQKQIDHIVAASIVPDPTTGVPIQIPYPQLYYDLAHDNDQMRQERAADVSRLDSIKRQADTLEKNRPSMKFAGVQRIIGPEGTPLRIDPVKPPVHESTDK